MSTAAVVAGGATTSELERGTIVFVVRPRVELLEARRLADVHRRLRLFPRYDVLGRSMPLNVERVVSGCSRNSVTRIRSMGSGVRR